MSSQPPKWPTYAGPAHIPYEKVTHRLWGDPTSGEVADWIYVSSSKIHQVVFGLPPGGSFRHSELHRTLFAADETFYVLGGILVLSNPQTGEVHRLAPGEAAFFRRDTWHHGFSYGEEALRVLEFFAPPPSQGTSQQYARTKPNLTDPRYVRDDLLGRWPMEQPDARCRSTIRVIREADLLWRVEGQQGPILVGLLASTEHITVGRVHLLPGQKSDCRVHGGDEGLYLLKGILNIRISDGTGQTWFELKPGDGFYIPEGIPHQFYNMSGSRVEFLFGVAPSYLPPARPREGE